MQALQRATSEEVGNFRQRNCACDGTPLAPAIFPERGSGEVSEISRARDAPDSWRGKRRHAEILNARSLQEQPTPPWCNFREPSNGRRGHRGPASAATAAGQASSWQLVCRHAQRSAKTQGNDQFDTSLARQASSRSG